MKISRTPTEHPASFEPYDYTYAMSRPEVLLTNAIYRAFDTARRKGYIKDGPKEVSGEDLWMASDIRVAFAGHIPTMKERKRQTTAWFTENSGLVAPRYENTFAPPPTALRQLYWFADRRVWLQSNDQLLLPNSPEEHLLLGDVTPNSATIGSLDQNFVELRPQILKTIHYLGRYIEGPQYNPDLDF